MEDEFKIRNQKMQIYRDKDIDIKILLSKKIGLLGYGSQGRSHALNLRDSGFNIYIGLREGSKSAKQVESDVLKVVGIEEMAKLVDIIVFGIPDEVQKEVYEKKIEPNLSSGKTLLFLHGFNIHYNQIRVREGINVVLVSPKGVGEKVREEYQKGSGVPCLVGVHGDSREESEKIGLAYAKGIGGGRCGIFKTSFKEETETDLFGEQSILCGGMIELMKLSFETLVEAGYQEEVAYFECLHEMKLIVDLIYSGGLRKMRESISNTAKYGGLTRGKRIITEESQKAMGKILEEITSGKFANEWIKSIKNNEESKLKGMIQQEDNHRIEMIGRKIRSMIGSKEDRRQDI